MAVSSRKVQNKRDSNGVLTGKAGTIYDVNINTPGRTGKRNPTQKRALQPKKKRRSMKLK